MSIRTPHPVAFSGEFGYLGILREVLRHGLERQDRTGVGTLGIFAPQLRFNLRGGLFPLLTTKRMSFQVVREELLWMLSGSTDVRDLQEHGVHIWDEWADEEGDLGPTYGAMWRAWPNPFEQGSGRRLWVDQIATLVQGLREQPDSRRHLVTAWNPTFVSDCRLPPCHVMFQAYSIATAEQHTTPPILAGIAFHDGERRELSLVMHQRSCDLFLGVPYNIAFYALLTHLLAHVTGHVPGELVLTLADAHIYKNHVDQVNIQLEREPLGFPRIEIAPEVEELEQFEAIRAGVQLLNYHSWSPIKAEVAV